MFDWKDYLDLANQVCEKVPGEAAQRTAISRAYYASYGKAWVYAESNGCSLQRSGSDHWTVWKWYGQQAHLASDENAKKALSLLKQLGGRLREKRVKADYNPDLQHLDATAEFALKNADKVLTELSNLP
jgi:hypothetical protein